MVVLEAGSVRLELSRTKKAAPGELLEGELEAAEQLVGELEAEEQLHEELEIGNGSAAGGAGGLRMEFPHGKVKNAAAVVQLQRELAHHAQITYAHPRSTFNASVMYEATAQSVRDRLVERWLKTEEHYTKTNAKRIYYLSLEYLVGRSLLNAILNLKLKGEYFVALKSLGYHLEETVEEERDAGLGNGGLGRLASCFLDSMATLNIPSIGYGIRYRYGIFEQLIADNKQVERPDYWLAKGNPWEVERLDVVYPIRFYGDVSTYHEGDRKLWKWEGGEIILAVAYDTPIPGYGTINTNTMRLWSARPLEEINLGLFNDGHHIRAIEARDRAEAITSVLYPNDNHDEGKELRLKQQYFFVSATLQDIMKRYKASGDALLKFDSKVAVQLNDTHPTIAIPELMRLLCDEEKIGWTAAWDITSRVFGYTNHTILPEALEKWSVPLMQRLLPRHLEIIYQINFRHLQVVEKRWGGDTARLRKMSIIEEGNPKMVCMAILATVGSHAINGVAEIHSGLVKTSLFPEFVELSPGKFQNKTNGVTPRRWILQANPALSKVITKAVNTDAWVLELDLLAGMKDKAGKPCLQNKFRAAKQANKAKLAALIKSRCGIEVSENALFDVQIKRIHEYKRQLLNILSLIHRYQCIKRASPADRAKFVPRVAIFAGKAAPGYFLAKRIIQLINAVGAKVNNDPDVKDLLKVVFIPNYSVSLAEVIIPASDISQHISTAGMEASGTSNMKFVMNGGLIIGTMDGANIEIANAIGRGNMFVFGASAEEVAGLRHGLKHKGEGHVDDRLLQVFHCIEAGEFGPYQDFEPILYSLREGRDFYLLIHDWPSYLDAQAAVDKEFVDESEWTRRCIVSTSMMGVFSSDRTIAEYASQIWSVQPSPVHPEPMACQPEPKACQPVTNGTQVPSAAKVTNGSSVPSAAKVTNGSSVPSAAKVTNGSSVPSAAKVTNCSSVPSAAKVTNCSSVPSAAKVTNCSQVPSATKVTNCSSVPSAAKVTNCSSVPSAAKVTNCSSVPSAAKVTNCSSVPSAAKVTNCSQVPLATEVVDGSQVPSAAKVTNCSQVPSAAKIVDDPQVPLAAKVADSPQVPSAVKVVDGAPSRSYLKVAIGPSQSSGGSQVGEVPVFEVSVPSYVKGAVDSLLTSAPQPSAASSEASAASSQASTGSRGDLSALGGSSHPSGDLSQPLAGSSQSSAAPSRK